MINIVNFTLIFNISQLKAFLMQENAISSCLRGVSPINFLLIYQVKCIVKFNLNVHLCEPYIVIKLELCHTIIIIFICKCMINCIDFNQT